MLDRAMSLPGLFSEVHNVQLRNAHQSGRRPTTLNFAPSLLHRPLRAASISIRAELLPFRGFVSALETEPTWRDLLPGALRSRMTAAAKAGRLMDP